MCLSSVLFQRWKMWFLLDHKTQDKQRIGSIKYSLASGVYEQGMAQHRLLLDVWII